MYVELNPAVPPIEPTRFARCRLNGLLRIVGPIVRVLLRRYVAGVEVVGREHLDGGPYLVLMNHACPFDPVLLTFYARMVPHFLVTEPFMADRPAARFAAWLGQIPKRKLEPDARAMRMMKRWCGVGGSVATFPEGQFPWDGIPLPLQPGLGDLVRYLEVPLVTVRLINGDRLWPAWAKSPRRTRLRIEIDPPRKFEGAEATDSNVEAYVAERIRVDPDECVRWPATGKNLAEGLARFLRFCFACGADEALVCAGCGGRWEVSGENRLRGPAGEFSIAEAWAKVRSALDRRWSKGTVDLIGLGEVSVIDASKPQWKPVTRGKLALAGGILSVGTWQVPIADVVAHTMDWGDLILIRTRRQRIALRLPDDSRAVWTYAFDRRTTRAV